MSGRFYTLLSITLTGLLLVGCAAGEADTMAGPGAPSPQPATKVLHGNGDIAPSGPRPMEPPPLAGDTFAGAEVLSEGQNLRYESAEPLFQVITTQQALDSFWQAYLPGIPLPEVDFGRSFVLAGIQGSKSTGGYDISFTGLEQAGDQVRVSTRWTEPAASESVDMGFTQPYTVLRVDFALLANKGALVFLFETEAGRELGRVPATIP